MVPPIFSSKSTLFFVGATGNRSFESRHRVEVNVFSVFAENFFQAVRTYLQKRERARFKFLLLADGFF